MTAATKKKIFIFIRYITRLGLVRGVNLYVRIHIFKQSVIPVFFLKHPVRLRPGTTDAATFDQIFVSRIYNSTLKHKPRFIIDCGANVGMASIYFANKYPESVIVAIEPEKSNFNVLQENCMPYENIKVLQKAIWSSDADLAIQDPGAGHYGFITRLVDSNDANSPKEVVGGISLSEIMHTYSFPMIDFLKIDIEGAEKELFTTNFENWLPKTRALMVETHDRFTKGASKAVIKAVAKYDFEISGSHEGFFCEMDDLQESA